MKAYAINGSPRKNWNTALLLEHALAGAASQGAETELIHLYDLAYKGCTSCFSCKLKDGKSYGRCAMNDGLTPVLEKLAEADVFILGSPIYFGTVTGEMRSFMERLLFHDDKVVFQYFDPEERKQRRINVFPEDCRKASELGARLAGATP